MIVVLVPVTLVSVVVFAGISVILVVSVCTATGRPELPSPFTVFCKRLEDVSICLESKVVDGSDEGGASDTESIDMF